MFLEKNHKAIIIVLFVMVIGLGILVFYNQKTISDQQNTIVAQQKEIDDLNKKVDELSQVTPDKLMKDAKTLVKQQGVNFLTNFLTQMQKK